MGPDPRRDSEPVELYKVTYPDVRRGPDGVSTALFKTYTAALAFSKHNRGKLAPFVVERREFRRLVYEKRIEQGFS